MTNKTVFRTLWFALLLLCCMLAACGGNEPAQPVLDSSETFSPAITAPATLPSVRETTTLPREESETPTPEISITQTREESTPVQAETTPAQDEITQPQSDPTDPSPQESAPAPITDFSSLAYGEEEIKFREKKSKYEDFSVSRRMRTVTVNGRKYCFDISIPEADCTERIRFTEELLMQAGISREFSICLYEVVKLKETYIDRGSLYGRWDAMSDREYMTAVLLAAFGEFANYGMAYGYAGLLLGEEMPEARYVPDWDYYDLNYLCFLSPFAGEEDVENAKAIALDFAHAYVARDGHSAYQELLEKSGRLEEAQEAREALISHYKENGAEPELSPLLYALGGTTYSHITRCEYATFYTERDWEEGHLNFCGYLVDEEWNDLLYDMYHCAHSYKAHRHVFETFRLEMQQLQQVMDQHAHKDNLAVFLVNNEELTNRSSDGFYLTRGHEIYLGPLYYYEHEYIHSLTCAHLKTTRTSKSKWIVEGLAQYYTEQYSSYLLSIYDCLIAKETYWGWGKNADFRDASKGFLADQGGQFNPLDFNSFMAYYFDDTVYDNPYFTGSAFIAYMVECFGEREVLDYFLVHHDLSRLTDKSIEELMEEWDHYLDERFKDYGKAEKP